LPILVFGFRILDCGFVIDGFVIDGFVIDGFVIADFKFEI